MVHVSSIQLVGWRRFTDLTISGLPPDARLVVLAGPNGTGKSSVFDGMRLWQTQWSGYQWDASYYVKVGSVPPVQGPGQVQLSFHEPVTLGADFGQQAFTFRTAYRMEADFQLSGISVPPPLMQAPRPAKMNDQDAAVSQNYQRLVAQALGEVFGSQRERTVGQVQDDLLGAVRTSMQHIFGDLEVDNLSDPLQGGSFFFSKGQSRQWHYKNLSGGERAAFDLLLDIAIKRMVFQDTVYCIDEPETHLNTRVQGALLREIVDLLPGGCQLWIASHSLGMLTEARRQREEHGDVVFIDFEAVDFDEVVSLSPVAVDRAFWKRTLRVALDDLAVLVAPKRVVLVEGRPTWESPRGNAEFDAACLREVFADDFPDTEFISVGGSSDVETDRFHLGVTTPLLAPGVEVVRVVDRDDRSNAEVEILRREGVRVLTERDLENYLLSDEALECLCDRQDSSLKLEVLKEKARLIEEGVKVGSASDDVKGIAGPLYVFLKKRLGLRQVGNDSAAFLRDTMTKCVRPGSNTYERLRQDLFG